MASPAIKAELLQAVEKLRSDEQQKVLEFARSLKERRIRGGSPEQVLELATGIDPDDLKKMTEAIEKGCERIEPNEW